MRMTTSPIHRFAVEALADGRFHLHIDRSLFADGKAYVSMRLDEGFESDAAARAFAKEHFGATDDDFSADPGWK